jgi:hypothetical protein
MRRPQETRSADPLKETTLSALERVVDPLVYLMFDAGITVPEFCRFVRERAVRSAAIRVTRESGRSSNSRVAIITGLARAEVARILNVEDLSSGTRRGQHPARRVLAAWYDNRRFLGANGDPAVLPIFGTRGSFEQLVAIYSGGIPVRAMLDQLTQINAVEILAGQRVKVKCRVPIFKGMTSTAIANVGERAGDLLETLGSNLRATANPLFEETAVLNDVDIAAVPLVRKQIADQGAAFIEGATSLLSRSRLKQRRSNSTKSAHCRVGVTVYYFQDQMASDDDFAVPSSYSRRKNLQRTYSKSKTGDKSKPSDKSSRRSRR